MGAFDGHLWDMPHAIGFPILRALEQWKSGANESSNKRPSPLKGMYARDTGGFPCSARHMSIERGGRREVKSKSTAQKQLTRSYP